ncbi:hypothetical protein SCG7109_AZ_00060 [Chlamydiales bacterium SCGC AG-110-M15]|nr:hypothetical protein SCG7109_AZ_00060 [Chlamydiales bacterium SCGC AG-110-M15]
MFEYIIRRLLLLPLTLFCIILVNFSIINLAPGEPTTVSEISDQGDITKSEEQAVSSVADDQYLQFREHYGLTLPILFNTWTQITLKETQETLQQLLDKESMAVKDYNKLRIRTGDQARFLMPHLLSIASNETLKMPLRRLSARFFTRGGSKQGFIGPKLSADEKAKNRKIAKDNEFLEESTLLPEDSPETIHTKLQNLNSWYNQNKEIYKFEPSTSSQAWMFITETRFFRYMSRVLTLDFGSVRNDPNKTVISEVTKRFKYSLTLAFLPMLITFVLCQVFGFFMAMKQNGWQDISLNFIFLILYATPVFVVGPFLIERIALNNYFPFTDTPIPISGFTSEDSLYSSYTSWGRLIDVLQHIFLPLVAIMYGGLAAQTRLTRTAVLEVFRQDYVRTARAKGLSPLLVLFKHVGRNASITIVTSIAGSLGVILGGSLIIETIFEINGFGRFFYVAIINYDYNVIMFSALAGAFLTLLGYLIADIAYTILDPRINLS